VEEFVRRKRDEVKREQNLKEKGPQLVSAHLIIKGEDQYERGEKIRGSSFIRKEEVKGMAIGGRKDLIGFCSCRLTWSPVHFKGKWWLLLFLVDYVLNVGKRLR